MITLSRPNPVKYYNELRWLVYDLGGRGYGVGIKGKTHTSNAVLNSNQLANQLTN